MELPEWTMKLKASIAAGNIFVILGLLFIFVEKFFFSHVINISFNDVTTSIAVLWILGFFFMAILLIFLLAKFFKLSSQKSLILFLFMGFIVPFTLGYLISFITAHGNSFEENKISILFEVLKWSLIGTTSSFFAWKSLKSSLKKLHNNLNIHGTN